MLPLVLVRRQQVELGDVGIYEEFEVQLSKRCQADQGGGWRECRRQTRARAVVHRAIPGARGRSNLAKIGRVVDLKPRLHGQHLVKGQWDPALAIDVARQQQIRAAIEDDAQLAAGRGDIVAAKRMVRMLEIADVAVADAARERERSHDSVSLERAADPRVAVKRAEVPRRELGGRLKFVCGRPGNQVHRPTDSVASIQRALRSAQHFDAVQIEKLHERHRRSCEVNAVEVHRRARIRPGVQNVGANPADCQLTEPGVLRKRD